MVPLAAPVSHSRPPIPPSLRRVSDTTQNRPSPPPPRRRGRGGARSRCTERTCLYVLTPNQLIDHLNAKIAPPSSAHKAEEGGAQEEGLLGYKFLLTTSMWVGESACTLFSTHFERATRDRHARRVWSGGSTNCVATIAISRFVACTAACGEAAACSVGCGGSAVSTRASHGPRARLDHLARGGLGGRLGGRHGEPGTQEGPRRACREEQGGRAHHALRNVSHASSCGMPGSIRLVLDEPAATYAVSSQTGHSAPLCSRSASEDKEQKWVYV